MYQITPSKDSFSELIITTIFTKMLNTFQAFLILYENGLASQARSLLRNNLEALFILNAISKDKHKVYSLIDNDNVQRLRLYKKIMNNSLLEQYKHAIENNPQLIELTENSKSINKKEILISDWAEYSDFDLFHKTVYSVLCADTHIDIRNLEEYLIVDSEDNIIGIDSFPKMKNFAVDLVTSIMIQLESLDTIQKTFSELDDSELKILSEETKRFSQIYINIEDED